MTMPEPPKMSRLRRPTRSTSQKATGVESTLTRVVTSEMRKGLEIVLRLEKKIVSVAILKI
jgi:hypothetical protein